MTTNRPESLPIWRAEDEWDDDEVVVRLSDYEALQAECEKMRAAIRRLCNIYVVDDYYMGKQREERLDRAVNRDIEEVQETKP